MVKKKKNALLKAVKLPLAIGAFSIGTNIAGQSLQPLLPTGVVNPLTSLGTTSAQFAGPIGTIAFLGIATKEIRKLKPKRRKK